VVPSARSLETTARWCSLAARATTSSRVVMPGPWHDPASAVNDCVPHAPDRLGTRALLKSLQWRRKSPVAENEAVGVAVRRHGVVTPASLQGVHDAAGV
jgi:hypothetical protein